MPQRVKYRGECVLLGMWSCGLVGQVQGFPRAQKTCQLPEALCPVHVGEPVLELLSVRWRLYSIRSVLANWLGLLS